jgi:hypothetical protein
MSARNHTQQHVRSKQDQRLAAMESLLDRLGSSTCRCSDWAQEKGRTAAFMAWIKEVQYNSTWPSWLVPKLTAAINRALQDDILGIFGPDSANTFICMPYKPGSHDKMWVVVDAYCSVSQLSSSLARLYRGAELEDASPGVTVNQIKAAVEHEILRQGESPHTPVAHGCWLGRSNSSTQPYMHDAQRALHCCAGLLSSMAAAGNALAAFIDRHRLLHWEVDRTQDPAAAQLQVRVPSAQQPGTSAARVGAVLQC